MFYVFLTKYAKYDKKGKESPLFSKWCSHNSSFSFIVLNSLSLSSEDVLSKDAGECAICLEELQQGDTIARLPCLCIYHKG